MQGEAALYRTFITLADDYTLMSPFGGTPSRGTYSAERWAQIGRFFRNGRESTFEVVEAYRSADMVVLAAIERKHVEVGGLPAQYWALRVTLVFRKDGDEWRQVHRHADPLAPGAWNRPLRWRGAPPANESARLQRRRPVTDTQWDVYVDRIVTPRFGSGLTLLEARGRWRDGLGIVVTEKMRVVELVHADSTADRQTLVEIVDA